jgi:hypothetical protein
MMSSGIPCLLECRATMSKFCCEKTVELNDLLSATVTKS